MIRPGARPDQTLLRVWIQPRAARSEVIGPEEGATGEAPRLRIRVHAPPADGKANEELLDFLARELGVPRSRIRLIRGAAGRRKDLLIDGLEPGQARIRLSRGLR